MNDILWCICSELVENKEGKKKQSKKFLHNIWCESNLGK